MKVLYIISVFFTSVLAHRGYHENPYDREVNYYDDYRAENYWRDNRRFRHSRIKASELGPNDTPFPIPVIRPEPDGDDIERVFDQNSPACSCQARGQMSVQAGRDFYCCDTSMEIRRRVDACPRFGQRRVDCISRECLSLTFNGRLPDLCI